MKKTGFNGYVNDFSVDYDATDFDDIVDIHNYLMKKKHIVNKDVWIYYKNIFLTVLLCVNLLTANSLSCISMKNQECKTRPKVVNVNGDEPVFFLFIIKTSKCSGSCNNINHPYPKICVPNVVKNLNVKVFNLMSRTNETRHIE